MSRNYAQMANYVILLIQLPKPWTLPAQKDITASRVQNTSATLDGIAFLKLAAQFRMMAHTVKNALKEAGVLKEVIPAFSP